MQGWLERHSGSELDQAPVVLVLPQGVVQAQEPILQRSRAQLPDVPWAAAGDRSAHDLKFRPLSLPAPFPCVPLLEELTDAPVCRVPGLREYCCASDDRQTGGMCPCPNLEFQFQFSVWPCTFPLRVRLTMLEPLGTGVLALFPRQKTVRRSSRSRVRSWRFYTSSVLHLVADSPLLKQSDDCLFSGHGKVSALAWWILGAVQSR